MIQFKLKYQNPAVPENGERDCAEGAAFGHFNEAGRYEGGPVVVWWYGYGRESGKIYNYQNWERMEEAREQTGLRIEIQEN